MNPLDPASETTDRDDERQPRLAHTLSRVAIATTASKLVGLVRECVIARAFGTGIVYDAYNFASQFSSSVFVIAGGLNGPFDTCTVTVLHDKTKAERAAIVRKIIGSTLINLTLLMSFLYALAPLITRIASQWYTVRPQTNLSLEHAKTDYGQEFFTQLDLMLPTIVMAGVLGILYGAAHLKHKVFLPSIAPAIQSLIVIAFVCAGRWLFNISDGYILALGTTIGALVQLAAQVPGNLPLKKQAPATDSAAVDKSAAEFQKIVSPAFFSTSVGQLTSYVDSLFAQLTGTGALSALSYSNRLIQLPLGILVTAMIVPMLPRFTSAANQGDTERLKADFHRSVRFLWFATLPALSIFMALVNPIVSVIYKGGEFESESVYLVTLALTFQLPSMFFYVARDLITRVFFAFRDTRTPFRIACCMLALKAALDYILIFQFKMDVAGITLATTLCTAVNFFALSILVRKRIDLEFNKLAVPLLKMFVSAGLCWLATSACFSAIKEIMPAGKVFESVAIGAAAAVGCIVYAFFCWLAQLDELNLLLSQIREKIRDRSRKT